MSRRGVREIARIFVDQFARGEHAGAQLVVLRRGQPVLNRTAGLARLGTTESVRPDTPFLVFSCTKPLTAVCLLQLVERGLVDLDAPIAAYWPEFGCRGKEKATVRHAFLHQAGIPARGLYPQIPTWWNWDRVTRFVAALPAEFEPGTRTAYHVVNYGFILGEILRRVDGRPIEQYMSDVLFEPLGMANSYLGLPAEQLGRASAIYWGHQDQRHIALLFRRARQTVLPAASLNTTAQDLAIFYQMILNGGLANGHRILQETTLREATRTHVAEHDHTLEMFVRWGLGFGVGGERRPDEPERPRSFGRFSRPTTFGHAGQRSSIAWADWDRQIVMAFTCNQLNGDIDASARWQALADAIWQSLDD